MFDVVKGLSMIVSHQTSLLAKLLATENITVQHSPKAKTATFNLKTRVLVMPIWQGVSRDLEDMLIVHETGHALDTPNEKILQNTVDNIFSKHFNNVTNTQKIYLLKKAIFGFINVIEDIRVNKKQKRRYPGSKKNFLLGYKELYDRNFYGTNELNVDSMLFIDRINIFCKVKYYDLGIQFTNEEKVLLRKVENAETYKEVEKLTEEIFLFCKDQINQRNDEDHSEEGDENEYSNSNDSVDYSSVSQLSEETEEYEDGEDSSEDEELPVNSDKLKDDESTSEENNDAGDTENITGDNDASEKSEDKKTEENIISTQANENAVTDNEIDEDQIPQSYTEEVWNEKSKDLVKDINMDYIYISPPDIDYNKIIHNTRIFTT